MELLYILIVLMLLGVPIAISIGLSSLIYIVINGIPLFVVAQRMFTSVDSIVLVAIPAFIVSGAVMQVGGLAKRLAGAADALFGRITGGFSIVAIITAAFFSAISGSTVATTAAVGGIMIPEMDKRGYGKDYSAAVAAAGGIMGVIIPPSVSMVIYSGITGTSLMRLFMAGIPVGVLMAISMIIVCYFYAKKHGLVGRTEKLSRKEFWRQILSAIPALGSPLIMVGGIIGGYFTPTEAAVVSIIYGIIVSVFVYKELSLKDIPRILKESMITSGKITYIMAAAGVLGWVFAAEQVPQQIFSAITAISSTPWVILLIINIILLIAGCFMETGSLLTIMTPILMPIVVSMGWNPVHFGMIMILNLCIGNITPPLGVCLYTGAMVADTKVGAVARKIIPFLIVNIIVLMLISYIPGISLLFIK